MEDLIWHLLKLPIEEGRILTKNLQVERKIQILKDLGALKCPADKLETLTETLKKIDYLRDDRNFIIHGSWGLLLPDQDPFAMSLRAKGPKANEVVGESFPA
jgi:hypothetical protein